MAYTEFRKSYGDFEVVTPMADTEFRKSCEDFEVVIPTVDFRSLTRDEAEASAKRLSSYVDGFVCHHLEGIPSDKTMSACKVIQTMLLANGGD